MCLPRGPQGKGVYEVYTLEPMPWSFKLNISRHWLTMGESMYDRLATKQGQVQLCIGQVSILAGIAEHLRHKAWVSYHKLLDYWILTTYYKKGIFV